MLNTADAERQMPSGSLLIPPPSSPHIAKLNIVIGGEDKQETLSFEDYLYFERLVRELGVHFQSFDFNSLLMENKDISSYTIHEASLTSIPLKYHHC